MTIKQARRRRKYRADPEVLNYMIDLNTPFDEAKQRQLGIPLRMGFDALLHGEGQTIDVSRLLDAMRIAYVTCEENIPLRNIAATAINALKRCCERHAKTGKWGLDGPARSEIEQGLELHEELARLATPKQLQDAAIAVTRLQEQMT